MSQGAISYDFLRLAENFLTLGTFWFTIILVPVAALVADVCVVFVRRWEYSSLDDMLREEQLVIEREPSEVPEEKFLPLMPMDSANEDVSVRVLCANGACTWQREVLGNSTGFGV